MNVKEMIQLNNEKRKLLNEENLKDYEEMLVYIRLSATKSEKEIEEILLELLEHLLKAQEEGKNARDVFGDDLKAYSQELIDEIPEERRKKQLKFTTRLILIFLAVGSLFTGIVQPILYYGWEIGESHVTVYLGSSVILTIISVIIAFAAIYVIIEFIKRNTFNQTNKSQWIEFFQLWLLSTVVITIYILLQLFMPTFGKSLHIPALAFIPLGLLLYGVAHFLKNN